MIPSWILPSFIALFLYGCWGFLGAKASTLTNTKTVFVISCLGTMLAGLTVIPFATRLDVSLQSISFSMLTGLATGFGTLAFIYALQRGPTIPILMITALYPLITLALTILFLHQSITLKQSAGVFFSILAIYFLTIP